jgi:hypothetical protein
MTEVVDFSMKIVSRAVLLSVFLFNQIFIFADNTFLAPRSRYAAASGGGAVNTTSAKINSLLSLLLKEENSSSSLAELEAENLIDRGLYNFIKELKQGREFVFLEESILKNIFDLFVIADASVIYSIVKLLIKCYPGGIEKCFTKFAGLLSLETIPSERFDDICRCTLNPLAEKLEGNSLLKAFKTALDLLESENISSDSKRRIVLEVFPSIVKKLENDSTALVEVFKKTFEFLATVKGLNEDLLFTLSAFINRLVPKESESLLLEYIIDFYKTKNDIVNEEALECFSSVLKRTGFDPFSVISDLSFRLLESREIPEEKVPDFLKYIIKPLVRKLLIFKDEITDEGRIKGAIQEKILNAFSHGLTAVSKATQISLSVIGICQYILAPIAAECSEIEIAEIRQTFLKESQLLKQLPEQMSEQMQLHAYSLCQDAIQGLAITLVTRKDNLPEFFLEAFGFLKDLLEKTGVALLEKKGTPVELMSVIASCILNPLVHGMSAEGLSSTVSLDGKKHEIWSNPVLDPVWELLASGKIPAASIKDYCKNILLPLCERVVLADGTSGINRIMNNFMQLFTQKIL